MSAERKKKKTTRKVGYADGAVPSDDPFGSDVDPADDSPDDSYDRSDDDTGDYEESDDSSPTGNDV